MCFLLPQHPDGFGWKISSTFIGGFAFALLVEVIVRTFRRIRGQSVGLADHHHGLPSPTMVRPPAKCFEHTYFFQQVGDCRGGWGCGCYGGGSAREPREALDWDAYSVTPTTPSQFPLWLLSKLCVPQAVLLLFCP